MDRTPALEFLAGKPLAIAPRYLGHMLAVLEGRAAALPLRSSPLLRGRRLQGTTVIDGIAVVPISGPILSRPDLFSAFGASSPADIRATIGAALEDATVAGVLLVVDSPGGEVSGVADLADALYQARGTKPMAAVADEGIFSAAYWIASAVGPIALPRTGSVGSIGALVVHQDISGALEQMGVRVSVIKSGKRKAMFSSFQPLSADARTALQLEVDRIAGMFFQAVARQRGLSVEQIAGYEGGTFEGRAALTAGLADAVRTVEGAFLDLKMHLNSGSGRGRTAAMNDDDQATRDAGALFPQQPAATVPAPTPPAPATTTAPTHPTSPARTNVVSIEDAMRRNREEARLSERQRATEIMSWCSFAGKPDLVEGYMASEMTIEEIRNDLLAQTASAGFEIHAGRRGSEPVPRQYDSIEAIYTRRKQAIAEARRSRHFV